MSRQAVNWMSAPARLKLWLLTQFANVYMLTCWWMCQKTHLVCWHYHRKHVGMKPLHRCQHGRCFGTLPPSKLLKVEVFIDSMWCKKYKHTLVSQWMTVVYDIYLLLRCSSVLSVSSAWLVKLGMAVFIVLMHSGVMLNQSSCSFSENQSGMTLHVMCLCWWWCLYVLYVKANDLEKWKWYTLHVFVSH